MAAANLKVLISGSGIAGTCLAFWLSKITMPVAITVLERAPAPRVTGQAIDIEGLGIEVVRRMKLDAAIRSRNTTERGTTILDSAGKPFIQFDAGEIFTSEYEILRADLAELFMNATADLHNVKYVYGDHVTSLQQSDHGVSVEFAKGSRDTFDLVVGADGAGSKIGPMILDRSIEKDSYRFLGQYMAFFSIPSLPSDGKMWEWFSAPKGLCAMMRPHRTPSTRGAYLTITTPAHGHRDEAVEQAMDGGTDASKKLLHAYFKNLGWQSERILQGMDHANDFYMSRAATIRLPKWTSERAVVIGDAAFATFGIGTTLAIMSGYYLAGELTSIESSKDIPNALQRYEQVFRPVYSKMVEFPPGFPQLAFPQTRTGIRIRDSVLWLVSKSRLYKLFQGGPQTKQTLPNYAWHGL